MNSQPMSLLSIGVGHSSHLAFVAGQIQSFACPGIETLAGKPSLDTLRIAAPTESPTFTRMPTADARLRGVVANHLALVWRVLRRTGLGAADAEDASQDVFWVLAQRFDDVPERAQRSFLISTALRVASDRKHSKWHRSVSAGLDVEARVSEATFVLPRQGPIHVHYHWMFTAPYYRTACDTLRALAVPADRQAWLEARLPIA